MSATIPATPPAERTYGASAAVLARLAGAVVLYAVLLLALFTVGVPS
jgi:hypothetical protein